MKKSLGKETENGSIEIDDIRWGGSSVVECLPSMCEAVCLMPSSTHAHTHTHTHRETHGMWKLIQMETLELKNTVNKIKSLSGWA
jgi:hypothetical protein